MTLSGLRKQFRKAVLMCVTTLGLASQFNANAQSVLDRAELEKEHQDNYMYGMSFGLNGARLLKPERENFYLGKAPGVLDYHVRPSGRNKGDWKISVNASHAFATTYFNSDLHIKTANYDLTVDNYAWQTRNQNQYFQFSNWVRPGFDFGAIFHEPPNTYTIAWEKNNNIFSVSSFHLKFLQEEGQVKRVHGTINGAPVDYTTQIDNPYDQKNMATSGLDIVMNQNTYMSLEFEAVYARRIVIHDFKKLGSFSYVPGVGLGIQTGENHSMIRDGQGGYIDYKERYKAQGFGGSVHNRIEWLSPHERFGFFYENKTALYHRYHGLLNGTQTFNLGYMSNSVGLTVAVYNPANHNKNKCPQPGR